MSFYRDFIHRLPSNIVEEHVNVFLKTPNSIYLGHIASAAVLLYIASQNPIVPIWFMIVWGFLELLCYPLFMEVWRRSYLKISPEDREPYLWIGLMDLLSFVVGMSWGIMTFVSLNPDNAAHFAVQMSIAAGATAAAIRSLATFPRSFTLYAIPYLGLLATRLFMLGEDFILLGGLVLVFLAMLLRFGSDVLQSVTQYIEISNENLDLAQRYREAAEEARHANREKTRLLAAASHDLRQPIHAIGLYLETLPIEKMEVRSRDTIQRIRNSLQSLSKLFNSLLDVSLLDSGKIQARPSLFDLEDMLNEVLDDYEPLAEIAHVTLMLECPKVGVMGDPILIRRMVQNLLSNAIRHSDGGSVRLLVASNSDCLAITVSDDGPGIAKEHQAIIFEEFTQVSQRSGSRQASLEDTASEQKGLGLGLAIVRRLADLQGLQLNLETGSTGTAIEIRGLKPAPLTAPLKTALHPSKRVDERFQKNRILVVDDDAETLSATVELLRKWGCQIEARSDIEGLNNLSGPFDLIISDYNFGADYTGIDIITRMRAHYGQHLDAIIISGDSSEAMQNQVQSNGLLLIHKPVQPVQLRSAMLEIFMSKETSEQVLS